MRTHHLFVAAVLFCLLSISGPSFGATITDTFTGGTNIGGWGFIPGFDTIEPTGGNPGEWLRNSQLDTFAPILQSSQPNSPFVGNLRAKQVTSLGVDARTDHADFGAGGRDFSLLLRWTHGTSDVSDDDFAYNVGPLVPQVGEGWKSYDFNVPSQSTDPLPAGWTGGSADDPEHFRPGVNWNDIITHADQVEFWWLNPAFFAIFQQWDVGVDNVRVTSIPEPTAAMAFLGVALVGLRRRRGCGQ